MKAWAIAAGEIVAIGLPFCVFKLSAGLLGVSVGFAPLGYALLALGAIDLALNATNLAALAIVQRRVVPVCLTELALHRRRPDLGLAIDVFVSFTIVAVVIGAGLLARLPAWALAIWNVAVILNVLGAGVGRLVAALKNRPAGNVD